MRRSETEKSLPPFDLKAAREKQKLTQVDAAAVLFTTQGTIARWERDGNTPQIYRAYWELKYGTDKASQAPQKKAKHTKNVSR